MSGSHAYGGDCPGMAGVYHYGGGGLGVLGSLIAFGGTNGNGYGYKSLSLPGDANKEYYFPITSTPAGLTITTSEDTGFSASAANGTYSVPFDVYEWGVRLGASNFPLTFGTGFASAPGASLTGVSTITPGAASSGAAASAPGATLTGVSTITAGAATGNAAGAAPGANLTGASTIVGGAASGNLSASAPGATLTGHSTIVGGGASNSILIPNAHQLYTGRARVRLYIGT